MGKMTSTLKPVVDRYNLKGTEERYQIRRHVRNFAKWYNYVAQVVRTFDKDMHKEYLFLKYLEKLIPADPVEPIDLDGKIKLEYYKLKKTFEGEISLSNTGGQYEPATKKGAAGKQAKSTLDEILEKINQQYKGDITEGDKVIMEIIGNNLSKDSKLVKSAKTSSPTIFIESIFPAAFQKAAMDGYDSASESFASLFQDQTKYTAFMNAMASIFYRNAQIKGDSNGRYTV